MTRSGRSRSGRWHDASSNSEPEVATLLERLAVEDPIDETQPPEEMVSRVVVNLVEASSQRLSGVDAERRATNGRPS